MTAALQERVAGILQAHGVSGRGSRIVAGVSGGVDSVALADLLREVAAARGLTLHLAHLDHGLRGASAEEAEFVRGLAARWRLPVTVSRRPLNSAGAGAGPSLEERARTVRYAFLLEVARRTGARAVAVAHTADDQAETVLLRLLRGTGLSGLRAMPLARPLADDAADTVWLVRPLLGVWRAEVEAYLAARNLPYRHDASNSDRRFTRNRIRHDLLPLLARDYNPNIRQLLVQLAEQSRSDDAYLAAAADRQWKRTVKPAPGGGRALLLRGLRRQPEAMQRQLFRRLLREVRGDRRPLEFRHWQEVAHLMSDRPEGAVVHLPGAVEVVRSGDRLVCRRTGEVRIADGSPGRPRLLPTAAHGILMRCT